MTKQRFLAIIYLLIGIILPAMAQTFTEQKKTYPVSADGYLRRASQHLFMSREDASIDKVAIVDGGERLSEAT